MARSGQIAGVAAIRSERTRFTRGKPSPPYSYSMFSIPGTLEDKRSDFANTIISPWKYMWTKSIYLDMFCYAQFYQTKAETMACFD